MQIKYGMVNDYGMKKDLLKDLLVYENFFGDELMSLDEYTGKIPEIQKVIY